MNAYDAPLTAERLRELLRYDPESGEFYWLVAPRNSVAIDARAGTRATRGYRQIQIGRKRYLCGRLAWLYMTGSWPKEEIDHRNRDTSDDRWSNLREATRIQNSFNRRAFGASGYKGVKKEGTKFAAIIKTNGISRRLGVFNTALAAHEAYIAAAKQLYGGFV